MRNVGLKCTVCEKTVGMLVNKTHCFDCFKAAEKKTPAVVYTEEEFLKMTLDQMAGFYFHAKLDADRHPDPAEITVWVKEFRALTRAEVAKCLGDLGINK